MPKRTKQQKIDPTGQARNRKRTIRAITVRLRRARSSVVTLFRAIPRTRRTVAPITNAIIYDYDLTPEDREQLRRDIQAAIDSQLETEPERVPPEWWYKSQIEVPYRAGTLEEINTFNQLIAGAVAVGVVGRGGLPPQRIPAELALTSQPYQQALRDIYVDSYTDVKGLSQNTAKQVMQTINAGVQSGMQPGEIIGQIRERFDVAESNAARIVNTEVNKAFTDAKMRASKEAANVSGLRAGVIHISALLPVTREHHAARHGNAYTIEDQEQWWNSDHNRINCYCSVRSVLVDSDGNVVQKELQQDLKDERN